MELAIELIRNSGIATFQLYVYTTMYTQVRQDDAREEELCRADKANEHKHF